MQARPLRNLRVLKATIALLTVGIAVSTTAGHARKRPGDDAASEWQAYGHDGGGERYSPLAQIDRRNVTHLQIAWTYRTGDLSDEKDGPGSAFEATPICVEGTLYLSTPFSRVIALDPRTGNVRWTYDPHIDRKYPVATDRLVSRGVSTWLDTRRAPDDPKRRRIFLGAYDGRLIALSAATGRPCADFGDRGEIDLKRGIGTVHPGEYQITSPPAIIDDLVIVGSAISDNQRVDAPSGKVRAYDARTGALRWTFEPVPRDRHDPARVTWGGHSADRTGAANAWSVISIDERRGLVFVPTGSPSPDFYGGERVGDNRYSNSIVALRARTGRVVWHFQVVHHDLWDYDIPAQPVLITFHRNGADIPAVVVATKMGRLFVLDRTTGLPLFPVEERPAPQEAAPGERPAATQPFPLLPPPLAPQQLTPDDAWGLTPQDREAARARISSLRHGSIFTPPSIAGTALYPGNIGGMNWSGVSFDPERQLLIANTNRLATIITLIPRDRMKQEFEAHPQSENSPQQGTPYAMRRDWLISPQRLPLTKPPWGVLTAVDLQTGAIRWERPLGTIPGLAGIPDSAHWGSLNLGGSIITAGGLVFIAAAMDDCLRAFDVETGQELWKGALPAGGHATPMTCRAGGKQYVVICAGGHAGLRTTPGDYVVAFALPDAAADGRP